MLPCDVAPYPGLLTPAFVDCSTIRGGRPGKTESHAMMYLDVWKSGTFLQVRECVTYSKHGP